MRNSKTVTLKEVIEMTAEYTCNANFTIIYSQHSSRAYYKSTQKWKEQLFLYRVHINIPNFWFVSGRTELTLAFCLTTGLSFNESLQLHTREKSES